MLELEKAIIVTNNDRVYTKYKDATTVILLDTYKDVLYKVRDLVYDRHILLTHPQASSLKPNQTPYRSVIVYPKGNDEQDYMDSILLIEHCIETWRQWQEISKTPTNYHPKVANDFKTIDLSVIDNVIPRIQ